MTLTAHARRTDPQTSHDAAASTRDRRECLNNVFEIFTDAAEPLTHEEVVRTYRARETSHGWRHYSESGIRTRVCELARLGVIEDSGQRGKSSTGRAAILWAAK